MCELSTARWTCPPGILTQEKSTQRKKQENRIYSSNSSIQFPAQGGMWCPVLAGGKVSSDWLCGTILSVVTLPPSSSFMPCSELESPGNPAACPTASPGCSGPNSGYIMVFLVRLSPNPSGNSGCAQPLLGLPWPQLPLSLTGLLQ